MHGFIDIYDQPHGRPRQTHVASLNGTTASSKRFLMIWFRCCNTYGRLYRNASNTRFEGMCPACGAAVHARIGPGGSEQRIFEAR